MQLIHSHYTLHVSGGKAETVSKRAEDIVSDLTKINNFAQKMSEQLDRLEENVELVKNKARQSA
jgi:hypothetical protein